jgi:hypothetical protein
MTLRVKLLNKPYHTIGGIIIVAVALGLMPPAVSHAQTGDGQGVAVTSTTTLVESADEGDRGLINLVIRNLGSRYVYVCRDWHFPSGQTTASTCPSATGYLRRGEDSKTKYGWADTDGIFIPSYVRVFADGKQLYPCVTKSLWLKVSPGVLDRRFDITTASC